MKQHQQWVVKAVDPKAEVMLFGSRARGDEREDSDWDVLVLTDYPVDLNKEREFRDKTYEVELETEEPISIFVYSKQDWKTTQRVTPFCQNVSKEGIVL